MPEIYSSEKISVKNNVSILNLHTNFISCKFRTQHYCVIKLFVRDTAIPISYYIVISLHFNIIAYGLVA